MSTPYIYRLTAILIAVTLIVFICAKLQVVIVPIIFSIIFSVMLYPIVKRLERWRFPRSLAAFSALLFGAIFVGCLLYFLGKQMVELGEQTPQLKTKLNEMVVDIQTYIDEKYGIDRSEQVAQMEAQLAKIMENGGKIMGAIIAAVANFVTDVVLIPLFVFFILYFRDFFLEFFHKAFDSTDNKIIDEILLKMHTVIQSWLVGVLLVMLIVGVLNTIGLLILGIPYAAFFGFLAAFLLIFPFIGIFLGSLLPVIMALLTKDSYWYAVGVVGVFWFIQILEANLITPYIVGSKISINPLVAVIVLLLFGALWGISGLILALPLTAICKVIFDSIPETRPYGFVIGEPEQRYLRPAPKFAFYKTRRKVKVEKDMVN